MAEESTNLVEFSKKLVESLGWFVVAGVGTGLFVASAGVVRDFLVSVI